MKYVCWWLGYGIWRDRCSWLYYTNYAYLAEKLIFISRNTRINILILLQGWFNNIGNIYDIFIIERTLKSASDYKVLNKVRW
jgi:hypothetical protein